MPRKTLTQYACTNCGAITAAWAGRCPQCGEWNTLQEETAVHSLSSRTSGAGAVLRPTTISETVADETQRISTDLADVDIVLGGGIVPGSIILVAGQPGVGKSTLLLQLANALAAKRKVIYISGEESAQQVALRARRLGTDHDALQLATTNSADDIAATVAKGTYGIAIVDSIQTMTAQDVTSAPGTVSQITASTQLIMSAAKQSNTAVIIVGHVTKEGTIAGPKVLEHVVDVVLQLEGEAFAGFKILRASKNRFGPTSEAGIFEMQQQGLQSVANPSAALLAERQASDGSIVLATMEGTRPLLVEVQALVNRTSYGYPKRAASGIDLNRINLLIAMLERRTKLQLNDKDIYINIVGGIRLSEPAADLAVCMAIGSAAKGLQLKADAVVFGEVGLSGEIRHVPFMDKRIHEAKKMGFDCVIGPKSKKGKSPAFFQGVSDVRSALNQYLEKET